MPKDKIKEEEDSEEEADDESAEEEDSENESEEETTEEEDSEFGSENPKPKVKGKLVNFVNTRKSVQDIVKDNKKKFKKTFLQPRMAVECFYQKEIKFASITAMSNPPPKCFLCGKSASFKIGIPCKEGINWEEVSNRFICLTHKTELELCACQNPRIKQCTAPCSVLLEKVDCPYFVYSENDNADKDFPQIEKDKEEELVFCKYESPLEFTLLTEQEEGKQIPCQICGKKATKRSITKNHNIKDIIYVCEEHSKEGLCTCLQHIPFEIAPCRIIPKLKCFYFDSVQNQ